MQAPQNIVISDSEVIEALSTMLGLPAFETNLEVYDAASQYIGAMMNRVADLEQQARGGFKFAIQVTHGYDPNQRDWQAAAGTQEAILREMGYNDYQIISLKDEATGDDGREPDFDTGDDFGNGLDEDDFDFGDDLDFDFGDDLDEDFGDDLDFDFSRD